MTTFHVSKICTAFKEKTIGTKVILTQSFRAALADALETYEMPASGQGLVPLPEAISFVSCGVGELSNTVEKDFVVREHRGKWGLYLKRDMAVLAESLSVVVYTKSAYIADPDFVAKEELSTLHEASHVIVAVLASTGPASPLPPQTLLHNIAGGNLEYRQRLYGNEDADLTRMYVRDPDFNQESVAHDLTLLGKIVKQAQETEKYWSKWAIVAD